MWLDATRAGLSAAGTRPYPAMNDRDRPGTDPSVAYRDAGWTIERSLSSPDRVSVGDRVIFAKRFTAEDVSAFAEVSGDTNRLHLDAAYAGESRFEEPIVHGTLVAGLISAALARFPGTTIYLSQETRFLAPVAVGDNVRAECEILEDRGDDRFRVGTKVFAGEDDLVVEGEAEILVDPTRA